MQTFFKKENLAGKRINGQVENPAQYNEIKKNIARLYTTLNAKVSKWLKEFYKVKW